MEKSVDEQLAYLKALVILQVAAMEPPDEREKMEVLLGRAGLPHKEIGAVLGKSVAAVAKAISRSK